MESLTQHSEQRLGPQSRASAYTETNKEKQFNCRADRRRRTKRDANHLRVLVEAISFGDRDIAKGSSPGLRNNSFRAALIFWPASFATNSYANAGSPGVCVSASPEQGISRSAAAFVRGFFPGRRCTIASWRSLSRCTGENPHCKSQHNQCDCNRGVEIVRPTDRSNHPALHHEPAQQHAALESSPELKR